MGVLRAPAPAGPHTSSTSAGGCRRQDEGSGGAEGAGEGRRRPEANRCGRTAGPLPAVIAAAPLPGAPGPQLSAVQGEVALRVHHRPGREAGTARCSPGGGVPQPGGQCPRVLSAGWARSSQVSPRHPRPWQGSAVKRTHSAAMRTHLASREDLSSLAVAAGSLSQPQAQPRATSLASGGSWVLGVPPAGPSLSPPRGRAALRVTRAGLQERPTSSGQRVPSAPRLSTPTRDPALGRTLALGKLFPELGRASAPTLLHDFPWPPCPHLSG